MSLPPLVSCLMPTYNRRAFAPRAIDYFLRQDYPNKELVILDDGSDPVTDLVPNDERIHYIRLEKRLNLGAKRNQAVEQAQGDLLMHWDDDDWYAPHRIRYQVDAMLQAGAEVCGLRQMLFYDPGTELTWLYTYPADQRSWLAGGSLLYTRDFWKRSPFPNLQVGEDTRFVWGHSLKHALPLPDYTFYVALIHSENTSPKHFGSAYWSHWNGNLREVIGQDLNAYMENGNVKKTQSSPSFSIIMVVHNALNVVRISTLRTLRHSTGTNIQFIVVDNASDDGTSKWLDLLAQRGDIQLIRSESNIGHGPGIQLALKHARAPHIVTLDSDAFPLVDDWLLQLKGRLEDPFKVVGILHHRNYIHPSCLMIAAQTLEDLKVTFLNEKEKTTRFDVAERISHEVIHNHYQIAGLKRSEALRRGSKSEPVYLGSYYEGIVYHQWYTTRAATTNRSGVDDVPQEALEEALQSLVDGNLAEEREINVIIGIRASSDDPRRERNILACLHALNLQDLERWRYRITVVEQDSSPKLEQKIAPYADRYVFAYNPGPYNRSWAFNIGATLPGNQKGVLCLIDADLLVPRDFLRRNLDSYKSGNLAIQPYTKVMYLDALSTDQALLDQAKSQKLSFDTQPYQGRVYNTSQGGCIWVDADLYRQIGGHDERFRGWGHEDREFWSRLSRTSKICRLSGQLLHLYHEPPLMDDENAIANNTLLQTINRGQETAPSKQIGNIHLYQAEAPNNPCEPPIEKRDWQNWYKWDRERIEQIVTDEKQRLTQTSIRRQIANLVRWLGSSFLDVGCGPGALWLYLESYRSKFAWTGIDVTQKMLEVGHALFPNVPISTADAASLPFSSASFDTVLLRHVLEHLPQSLMEKSLAEALRVARQAVLLDFYIPLVDAGSCQTTRVGMNFLETHWATRDIVLPVERAGWKVCDRLTIQGRPDEKDMVWILRPDHSRANNQKRLKVSIIMPTYQRSHIIQRTIQMIQSQTYTNWELIVVDNSGDTQCSFDDPRITVHHHAEVRSASYARNQGLQYATGDLICFFDDDDDMFPQYIEKFVSAFEAHPFAKIVRCGMIVDNGTINYSFATPECCLRTEYATRTWQAEGPGQDQKYFKRIIKTNKWKMDQDDGGIIEEALCRANAHPVGGLRSGNY